jgi:hypothetical protein
MIRLVNHPLFFCGDVAQLVERLLCKQNVAGSIPVISTISLFYPTIPQEPQKPALLRWLYFGFNRTSVTQGAASFALSYCVIRIKSRAHRFDEGIAFRAGGGVEMVKECAVAPN